VRLSLALILCMLLTAAARASDIELVSGEVLKGAVIVERGPEQFVIQHPILGRIAIRTTDIKSIDGKPTGTVIVPPPPDTTPPPGSTSPPPADGTPAPTPISQPQAAADGSPPAEPATAGAEQPAQELPPAASPPMRAIEPELVIPWVSQLEFGGIVTEGATDSTNFILRYRTTRTDPRNTTRVDMNYRLSTNDGDRTANRFDVGVFSEWKDEGSLWNVFAQGRFENAEFQAWDQRITASGGLGYQLMDLKDVDDAGATVDFIKLVGRVGGGARQEFGSDEDDVVPEGLVGFDLDLRLSEDQRITGNTRYFPDLDRGGEFRVESNFDWTIDIDKLKGVSLRLGVQHEYNSQSPSDIPNNDVAARATLVINF